MGCFLKSTETKEWLQQHTTLSRDREDKGEKLISVLLTPPHPSRKEAEPTEKTTQTETECGYEQEQLE